MKYLRFWKHPSSRKYRLLEGPGLLLIVSMNEGYQTLGSIPVLPVLLICCFELGELMDVVYADVLVYLEARRVQSLRRVTWVCYGIAACSKSLWRCILLHLLPVL